MTVPLQTIWRSNHNCRWLLGGTCLLLGMILAVDLRSRENHVSAADAPSLPGPTVERRPKIKNNSRSAISAPRPKTRHVVALSHIGGPEVHNALSRIWGTHLQPVSPQNGDPQVLALPVAPGEFVQISIDRNARRVEISGPESAAIIWSNFVRAIDKPSDGQNLQTQIVPLHQAPRDKVKTALSALQQDQPDTNSDRPINPTPPNVPPAPLEATELDNVPLGPVQIEFVDGLDVDEVIAQLLVTEGFSSVEEVAFIPVEELAAIEGFDDDVCKELRERARQYLEVREADQEKQRKDMGVSDEIAEMESLTGDMLLKLGETGIKTLDDLADLAGDELMEVVGGKALTEDQANEIIMAARAHWFEGEERVEPEVGNTEDESKTPEPQTDSE